MALPIQTAPSYTLTLPVSKQVVKFRPFLVKEQRSLLVARESEETKQILNAVLDMISAVTDKTVNPKKMAVGDLEYLFLQIRAKSVGETAKINVACQEKDCNGWGQVDVDLNEVEVDIEDVDNKVELSDNLIAELQYPNVDAVFKAEGLSEADSVKPIMRGSIVRLFDEENVYDFADYSNSEIDEFIDSLTVAQFEKVSEFFQNVPTLRHEVEYTCTKCKTEQKKVLEGLNNFFS
ncbi:MAG: hypothetical protein VYE09_00230 [Pseudomonadota bacterium]|jgi:hypothetical protein|nr:hypothetical protein [Pseudomonadota bacterium]|tara:strand:+ start:502 stop:1206 length:705 start_codon:yes stop_codon:yes gene_type:complete